MKRYLIIFFIISLFSNLYGQDSTLKNFKQSRNTSDTLSLTHNRTINAKIDTLYFRNLNSSENNEDSIWHDIISIIGILIAGCLGWLSQFFLKGQEKNVNSHNLKEVKRIQHLEQISSFINDLAVCDPQNSSSLLSLNSDLRNYVFKNSLYIEKKYEKVIDKICDYYGGVSADYRLKDLAQELDLWNQFKILFSK